jgi:hypothetical protein
VTIFHLTDYGANSGYLAGSLRSLTDQFDAAYMKEMPRTRNENIDYYQGHSVVCVSNARCSTDANFGTTDFADIHF